MSQKKKKRKAQREAAARSGARSGRSAGAKWSTTVVLVAFGMGVALGAAIMGGVNAMRAQEEGPTAVAPPPGSPAPPAASATDGYGRRPGDEHYGHDHP